MSVSEKHTPARDTPKPPKQRSEETAEKTPNTAIKGRKMEREGRRREKR
jgi:hypothetical protein